ncbi:alpha-L-fucosidase [Pseudoduganella sp. LjRoot289]|uniref:alpha-L-fucosidase n=1 Tax=Pseudoduganella sp. LjRoot289 TaxID=3342314 RepID=UPI003ECC86F4
MFKLKYIPTALRLLAAYGLLAVSVGAQAEVPPLPPRLPIDSVPMGDVNSASEVKLDLAITPGPFEPTWESIEKQYPGTPSWLRDAKFGIWVHFGPQAAGMSGDWYARKMYVPGTPAYNNHLKNNGHPSVEGYKEVLRDWNPRKLDPAKLTAIYKDAGARFLIVQGVHHDNFDLWNSRHHPWNSTRMGARRDFVGEWSQAAKAAGMRYGVAFHHEYSWWWWQTAFGSDTQGELAGVPYDGNLTLADGKGKWWEGLDPRLLYNADLREYKGVNAAAHSPWSPPPAGVFGRHTAYATWYATQWARRIMDVVEHYEPDFIYTDGTGAQPFSGSHTGTGIKADATQRVIADFYNQTLKKRGKVDTFSIIKFRPTTNGTVNTEEGTIPAGIKSDQPWIAETPVGDWYYGPGFSYDSGAVIHYILEQVARDGNAAICISPLPDGSLDDGSARMLKEIGAWMRINGEGIYGSKAWRVLGEGENGKLRTLPGGSINKRQAEFQFGPKDFRFTSGKDGTLYAFSMAVPAAGSEIRISSLGASANLLGKPVSSVSLLGHQGAPLHWKQEADALVITVPSAMPFATAVAFNIR